jgi:hypothetical protein
VTFVVSGIEAGIAVAAGAAGHGTIDAFPFLELIQTKVEQASALTVHERNAYAALRPEQQGQGLQVEAAVDEELASRKLGGEIVFAPEITGAAGENYFGVSLVAVKSFGDTQHTKQVGAGTSVFPILFRLPHGAAHEVFRKDRFFAMGFILRRTGLEVKTESTTVFVIKLELRQLTDVFAGNHRILLLAVLSYLGTGAWSSRSL